MDERKSLLSRDPDEHGSPFGWRALAVVVAVVVWMAFRPLGPVWLYLLGWTVALAAVDGLHRLVRRQGWAVPSPGASWLGCCGSVRNRGWWPPRWAKVRLVAVGFLMFATIAGYMGWQAGQEYRLLANLRDQGHRTDTTVVEITDRSEEGRVLSVTVRFGTPSGAVRADVDVVPNSANDAEPGAKIPVAYNPARPTEVRQLAYLDGREADGIRQGSIVIGLLAAGFLAGTIREVLRAKRQTESGKTPGTHNPRT